jgi:hypothetical protein
MTTMMYHDGTRVLTAMENICKLRILFLLCKYTTGLSFVLLEMDICTMIDSGHVAPTMPKPR